MTTKAVQFEVSTRNRMEQKKYKDIYRFVASFYHHLLCNTIEGEKAFAYLLQRGFTEETIKSYELGYSGQSDLLVQLLINHGYDTEEMKRFGLVKEDGRRKLLFTGFFHNRVMFPIHNECGEILAFSGRTLPGDNHPVKYLNTGETPFFTKGDNLYNIHAASEDIKDKDMAILFEGYFDSISANQHDIKNIISVMGTALTDSQMKLLSRYSKRAVVCLDGDSAGLESAKRNGKLLIEKGFDVRLALLPDGVDPHDFLSEHNRESFMTDVIDKALSYPAFVKEYARRTGDFSSEVGFLEYAETAITATAPTKESRYLFNEIAFELEIPIDLLKSVYRKEKNR